MSENEHCYICTALITGVNLISLVITTKMAQIFNFCYPVQSLSSWVSDEQYTACIQHHPLPGCVNLLPSLKPFSS